MKRIFLFLALILSASSAFAQQSGYGGDGKAASGATVSSFIRLYETAPGASTTALAGAGAGNVDNGAHLVKVTCYTPGGQTTGGTTSNSTTVADKTIDGKIAITGIPTCSVVATGRKVYMTAAGGSSYFLLSNGTIANNTATTLTANDADATLLASTALPTSNTALDTRLTVGQNGVTFSTQINGNLGIGTGLSAPAKLLHLNTSSTGNEMLRFTDANEIFGFGINGSALFTLYENGTKIWGAKMAGGIPTFSFGLGTITPVATVDVVHTSEQLRLRYDTSNYASFITGSTGNLAINPTGGVFALGPLTPATIIGAAPTHAQGISILQGEELLTIAAAATTDTAFTVPANCVIKAVSVRVTTVIPTAATFTVTGATSGTVFNTANVSTAATSTDPGTKAYGYFNGTAQKIRITPDLTPGAATGVVRVTVVYEVVTPPTS